MKNDQNKNLVSKQYVGGYTVLRPIVGSEYYAPPQMLLAAKLSQLTAPISSCRERGTPRSKTTGGVLHKLSIFVCVYLPTAYIECRRRLFTSVYSMSVAALSDGLFFALRGRRIGPGGWYLPYVPR